MFFACTGLAAVMPRTTAQFWQNLGFTVNSLEHSGVQIHKRVLLNKILRYRPSLVYNNGSSIDDGEGVNGLVMTLYKPYYLKS